jgi:hypothetical protein
MQVEGGLVHCHSPAGDVDGGGGLSLPAFLAYSVRLKRLVEMSDECKLGTIPSGAVIAQQNSRRTRDGGAAAQPFEGGAARAALGYCIR